MLPRLNKGNKVKLLLWLISCLLGLFLAEGILIAFRSVKNGRVGWDEAIRARRELRGDVIGGTGNRFENRLVLHPLFGYTYNPRDDGINNFGFRTKYHLSLTECGPFIRNAPSSDPLVIGIFGGSFAEVTGMESDYLEHQLSEVFPHKKPTVMNFGVGGHALPQSAFIYMYFRELFDVVIFIDGLNELWNYVENNKRGFPPEYAKASHYTYKVSMQELTPSKFDGTARILSFKRNIALITSVSLLPIIRQSMVVHYAWAILQTYWSRKISEESRALVSSHQATKFFDAGDDAILDYAARKWRSYHNLIHHVSLMEGTLSIHLLQPNPFVPNSKPLTPDEDTRVTNSYPIQSYVVQGYPKLRREIRNLHAQGLIIEDLSDAFNGIKTSIWTDAGHANRDGSRLIMDRIVRSLRISLKTDWGRSLRKPRYCARGDYEARGSWMALPSPAR